MGKVVKTLREQLGWTLKELSKRSGVPVGTISALENRDSVRSEYAANLAAGLGVPVERLLAIGQGTPDTQPAQLPGSGDGALDAVATAALVAELARRIKKIPRDQRSFMAQEAAALVMSPDSEETRAALAHYLQFGDERLPTTTTQLHDREPHATEPTAHKGNVRS